MFGNPCYQTFQTFSKIFDPKTGFFDPKTGNYFPNLEKMNFSKTGKNKKFGNFRLTQGLIRQHCSSYSSKI